MVFAIVLLLAMLGGIAVYLRSLVVKYRLLEAVASRAMTDASNAMQVVQDTKSTLHTMADLIEVLQKENAQLHAKLQGDPP